VARSPRNHPPLPFGGGSARGCARRSCGSSYLIADRLLLDQLLTYLAAAFAYYLYLAYAEGLTTDYERGRDLIASRGTFASLLEAASFVPRVLVAALVTISRERGDGAAYGPRSVALHALVAVYPGDLQ
jgi:hypothetical protein